MNVEEIVAVDRWSKPRQYWKNDTDLGRRRSDWKSLEKGKNYYIEARHVEKTGGDHISVAVEIEQTATKGHYHSMREVQFLGIDTENNKDTTRVTLSDLDKGDYILSFQNPKTLKYT